MTIPHTTASGAADDSLLLCASDLQHSAIYDNPHEMVDCVRAVADRITALAASAPVAPTPPDWRELCRRLYVELFHCDKQMTCSLNEDGKPIWRTGTEVRDVLSDAKAALEAYPITPEAAPVAPAPQPAGFVLVPVNLNGPMLSAVEATLYAVGKSLGRFGAAHAAYKAMLAAAPKAPPQQGEYLPLAVASAPDRIWLDLGFDPKETDADFSDLNTPTWSADNASGHGIEYVRADRAARGAAQAAPADVRNLLDYAMQIAHERELHVTGHKHDSEGATASFIAACERAFGTSAQPAPVAEDAEDAARYRWLKLQARPNEPFELFDKLREAHALVKAFDVFCTRWGGWDASIDAARAQAAQPEGGAKT